MSFSLAPFLVIYCSSLWPCGPAQTPPLYLMARLLCECYSFFIRVWPLNKAASFCAVIVKIAVGFSNIHSHSDSHSDSFSLLDYTISCHPTSAHSGRVAPPNRVRVWFESALNARLETHSVCSSGFVLCCYR